MQHDICSVRPAKNLKPLSRRSLGLAKNCRLDYGTNNVTPDSDLHRDKATYNEQNILWSERLRALVVKSIDIYGMG